MMRRYPVTIGLVLVCLAVFAVQVAIAGWSPSAAELESMGGSSAAEIRRGHFWVVFTSNFLHVNVAHLLMNVVALLAVGLLLELRIGSKLLLATALLACLVATPVALVAGQTKVSVGASVILLAWVLVAVVLDPAMDEWLGPVGWGILAAEVIIGIVVPGIDNLAHVAGAVVGLLVGVGIRTFSRQLPDPQHPDA
jgi:rhomboid protease GluP